MNEFSKCCFSLECLSHLPAYLQCPWCCLFVFLRCLQSALRRHAVAASALHTTGLLQTSNRTSVVRFARNKYERQYPVLLVRPDGSTINIRYKEPKRILMVWKTVHCCSQFWICRCLKQSFAFYGQISHFRLFSWKLIWNSDSIFVQCLVDHFDFLAICIDLNYLAW